MTYDTSGGVSSDSSSSSGGFSSFSALLGGLADAAIKPIYKAFGLSTDEPSGSSTSDDHTPVMVHLQEEIHL